MPIIVAYAYPDDDNLCLLCSLCDGNSWTDGTFREGRRGCHQEHYYQQPYLRKVFHSPTSRSLFEWFFHYQRRTVPAGAAGAVLKTQPVVVRKSVGQSSDTFRWSGPANSDRRCGTSSRIGIAGNFQDVKVNIPSPTWSQCKSDQVANFSRFTSLLDGKWKKK